jgi:ABC-type nitrate/sulfonate/bicarbonate transport system substrate-binding protein
MRRQDSRINSRAFWPALLLVVMMSGQVVGAEDPVAEVRIAGSAWVGDQPTKVADELGFFNAGRSPGSPVIVVDNHGSGLDAVAVLLRGEAQFALAATTPVALALVGALDEAVGTSREIVVLASVALSNQTHTVVSPSNRNIAAPADVAGRRVGIMFGTSSHYGWSQFSVFHGFAPGDVELVNVPISRMGDALLGGLIDAAVIWPPWDQRLRSELGEDLTEFELRMIYTVNWLLLAERDFVVRHPEIADRVMRGYLDAMKFIDRNPARARDIHARQAGLDPDELARSADGLIWRLSLNWSTLVNMGSQLEWLANWPELAGLELPAPTDYLFADPLLRTAPWLVTLPPYLLNVVAGPPGGTR